MRISVTAKKKSPTTANHLRRRKALGSERKRQLLQKVLLLKGWPIRSHDHFSFTHLMEYWNYNIVLFFYGHYSWGSWITYVELLFFFFECSDQFARIMINFTVHWTSCKPSKHVRHRENNRHVHKGSNSGAEKRNKSLPPQG